MILRKSSQLALVALVTLLASAPAQAGFFPRFGKFTFNSAVVAGSVLNLMNLKKGGFAGTRTVKAMLIARGLASVVSTAYGLNGMKDAVFAESCVEDVEDIA
jgi:hypothetical protein